MKRLVTGRGGKFAGSMVLMVLFSTGAFFSGGCGAVMSAEKEAKAGLPIGWWTFDETAGTTARNSGSLGRSAEGRLNNMNKDNYIVGRVGAGALLFDGVDDDITIPALNLNCDKATICAWLKREGEQAVYAGIVYSRDGDTIAGIGSGSTGKPDWKSNHELFYCWNDTEDTWAWHSGLFIPDNKWVFVAMVLEPAKTTLYLGEDGKIVSATNTVKHGVEEFNGTTRIGNDLKPKFPPRYFKGMIDDVRIYRRALSAEEIVQLAKGGG